MRKLTSLALALYMVTAVATFPAQADTTHRSYDALVRAVQQNPNDMGLRREIAKAMIARGQAVRAAEQAQLTINSGTATADDWTTLGEALRYAADFRGAINAYTNALRISPLNAQALGGLALAYASSGQTGKALSICRTGLSQTSDPQGRQYIASALASVQNMNAIAQANTGSVAR